MMTKKQFCRMVLENNKHELGVKTDKELIPHVFSSTSLGIALEFLGVITNESHPDICEYLASRGGVLYGYYDTELQDVKQLSFRELLSLLPDDINDMEENNNESSETV